MFFEGARIGSAEPDGQGRITLDRVSVPGDSTPGASKVTSSCSPDGESQRSAATFTVVDKSAHRTALITALALPGQISLDPTDIALSVAVGISLMMVLTFPSELFNATLEENYNEVRSWFRLPAKAAAAVTGTGQIKAFGAFVLAGGTVFAALSSDFGLNMASLALVVGMAAAVSVVALGFGLPANLVLHRRTGEWGRIGVLPGTILVAIACVGFSRLVGFQPGYFYGVIAGFTFRHELDRDTAGRLTAAGCLFMLVVSVGSWLLRAPVSSAAAAPGAGIWWIGLEAGLAATFLLGMESLAFGLLPLRFLNGSKVFAWSRLAWAALFALSLAVAVHILLAPSSGYSANTSRSHTLLAASAYLVFALASVGLWAYFRWRPERWISAMAHGDGEIEFADIERL